MPKELELGRFSDSRLLVRRASRASRCPKQKTVHREQRNLRSISEVPSRQPVARIAHIDRSAFQPSSQSERIQGYIGWLTCGCDSRLGHRAVQIHRAETPFIPSPGQISSSVGQFNGCSINPAKKDIAASIQLLKNFWRCDVSLVRVAGFVNKEKFGYVSQSDVS